MEGKTTHSKFLLSRGYEDLHDFYIRWNLETWRKCDEYVCIEDMTYERLKSILEKAGIEFDTDRLKEAVRITPKGVNTR